MTHGYLQDARGKHMTVMDYIQSRRSEPFNPPKKRQSESRIAIRVKEKRRKEKKRKERRKR
jgi:hypothetical protein